MKKGIIVLTVLLSFGFFAQAQTITKRDTKKVSKEINENIDQIEVAINNTDWKELQKVVDKTATAIEDNANDVIEIFEEIDFSKLVKAVNKMADEIEENVDTRKIEKAVEKIGSRIDKVVIEIETDKQSK